MTFSDPSKELEWLLGQLPVGAPVGLAELVRPGQPQPPGSRPTGEQRTGEPGEIVLAIGLDASEVAAVRAGLRPDAVLVVEQAVVEQAVAGQAVVGQAVAEHAAAGPGLIGKPAGVSWRALHAALVQPRLRVDDELADLAQTIATLTGGLVTIEDTSSRVLAYSRSSDEVDELRRLSILGRSGPPEYLALLREWGVYDRLATSEEVVEIAEHPESGVRRRLAVGIFAGRRQLGTIWVQQGRTEFGPHAAQALLGAARLTATQLVGGPPRGSALADLLGGRSQPDALGADATRPALVAVLGLDATEDDPPEHQQKLDQLRAVATVHAAGLRRRSMTERIGELVVLLLPNLDETSSAAAMLAQAAAAAHRVTGNRVRVGLGSPVATPGQVEISLRQAEQAIRVGSADTVQVFERVRNQLLTKAVENYVDRQPDLLDPQIARLIEQDPDAAKTLLRYLDTGSDVSRVATDLAIHPTTVRYRLRRTAKLLALDLTEPDDRLSVQLQLRHGLAPGH